MLMYLNVFVRLAGTRLRSAIEVCKSTLWGCLQTARQLFDSRYLIVFMKQQMFAMAT